MAACSDPTEPPPLGGDTFVENGVLLVRGDGGANDIRVTYSTAGVDVERDGESVRFTDVVQAIEISAGEGSNLVRYAQTAVAGVALTIATGAGNDDVLVSFDPAGSGSDMAVTLTVDAGEGSDRLDFRWNGAAAPALNAYITIDAKSTPQAPEVADEVLVAFEHGDPDRPVVIGALYNGRGSPDSAPGGDERSLSLELDFRAGLADLELVLTGGAGPDHLELEADYSGVTLQQGRVIVDADLNEGDNYAGKYIVTSATHTSVETSISAGGGNNVVDLESVLGGDGDLTYAVRMGDGDNETTIRFGDGVRGRRPAAGQRNVTATYRSGSGVNAVNLDADVVEPLASDFSIDYGTGQGHTTGRVKLKFPWDQAADTPPGSNPAPSQVKVVLMAPMESALDLRVDVGDPEEDDPQAFGAVGVTGASVQQTDFEFLHQRASRTGSELEEEWEVHLSGLATTGDAAATVEIPPGLERLVYLQDAVDVAAGATMKVTLEGDAGADAVLAHLIGLSGAGRFELVADGAGGDDLIALLTRDLQPAVGGEMLLALLGGDGDDVLGVSAPVGTGTGSPIEHLIAGGSGSDACFAGQEVAVTECERLESVGDELIRLLESVFGQALADVWRE